MPGSGLWALRGALQSVATLTEASCGPLGMMLGVDEPLSITIGPDETERVNLKVLRRERPNDDDYWDGNWLVVEMHVRVGGFVGQVKANLRAEDFQMFRAELETAYRNFGGVATFETIEHWLTLTITCEKTGRVTVVGEATDLPGMGNRLSFQLPDIDQTFLPDLIDQLASCERAYPVVGQSSDG